MDPKPTPESKSEPKPTAKQRYLISLRQQKEKAGKDWIDVIQEHNPNALTADGFESCVIGSCQRFGWDTLVAYDYDKCVELLVQRDGMTYEEAVEYMDFNVTGAWVGEGTPVFISTRSE